MSKLFSKIAGATAAAALVLSVGVGSAAANVTRIHESNGDVVSVDTPNVSTPVGTTAKVPVTVSVSGPSPLLIATEKFLNTLYGVGDSQFDGLSFANYGCWGRSLSPGQACTSTIAFAPSFVGTHNESYMLETGNGKMYGGFTATGLRAYYRVIPPISGLLVG